MHKDSKMDRKPVHGLRPSSGDECSVGGSGHSPRHMYSSCLKFTFFGGEGTNTSLTYNLLLYCIVLDVNLYHSSNPMFASDGV